MNLLLSTVSYFRNEAVVPYDFNRVILRVEDDEFLNDYINASIFK